MLLNVKRGERLGSKIFRKITKYDAKKKYIKKIMWNKKLNMKTIYKKIF